MGVGRGVGKVSGDKVLRGRLIAEVSERIDGIFDIIDGIREISPADADECEDKLNLALSRLQSTGIEIDDLWLYLKPTEPDGSHW